MLSTPSRALLALCIALVVALAFGCNQQGGSKSVAEKPTPEKALDTMPASTSDQDTSDSAGAIRLRQGTNPRVGEYDLGVMSVGEGTRTGTTLALEIKLSVYHRETEHDEERLLRVGHTLDLGDAVYVLIRLEPARGEQRGYGVIVPK